MPHLSDHDLKQMDDAWVGRQPELVLRALLGRTLDDLRLTRDRLNQTPNNSSRPPTSRAPWQRDTEASKKDALLTGGKHGDGDDDGEDESIATAISQKVKASKDSDSASDSPPQADAAPADKTALPTVKHAGRAQGDPGYARSQKLAVTCTQEKHPPYCAACQRVFSAADPAQAWTAWDTLELCAIKAQTAGAIQLGAYIEVTRHVLMQRHCSCGHSTRALANRAQKDRAWEGVHISEQRLLGPRLAATVVYLSLRMRLPRFKVQELMFELFALEISTALIDQTIKQSARSVEPLTAEMVEQLEQAAQVYADETSWRECTQALWLWVLCCSHTVLYVIGARTKEMFDDTLSLEFKGRIMSDGYGAYRRRENRLRCWAHLLRKLKGVAESTNSSAAQSGQAMLGLFGDLMAAVFQARGLIKALQPGADPPAPPAVSHAKLVFALQELCKEHRDATHDALRAISREFLNDWTVIMHVLTDPGLPLTNNAAERQLRHWVIARRISYGTRNMVGSNSLALLASVIDTCRLRQASVTDLLARAIHAARQGLPAPALPPIPAHLLGLQGALMGK